MSFPNLVAADAAVTVTACAQINHTCPFKQERDAGTITISWKCIGSTIELHSLAEYLNAFSEQSISHEDLVALIAADLQTLGTGIHIQAVTASFTTADIAVEVTRAVHDYAVDA